MLPLLVSAGFIGFEHRAEVIDLYRAAYPADPIKREALEECVRRNPNFNRLDTIDRDGCYAHISDPWLSYAHSPSQVPVTDIRRQQANDGYRLQVASTAPARLKAAQPHRASRNNPNQ